MAMLRHPIYLPSDVLEALAERTGHFWSTPDNEAIIIDAVRAWMNPTSTGPAQQPAARSEAGYQEVKYCGYAISPSGFANSQGSGNRNAWKAVWLRFPGSDEWLLADVCRLARKAAIARMMGDDTRQVRQRAQTPPGQRQGKSKPKSQRRQHAGGSAARQPIAAPQQLVDRLSSEVAVTSAAWRSTLLKNLRTAFLARRDHRLRP